MDCPRSLRACAVAAFTLIFLSVAGISAAQEQHKVKRHTHQVKPHTHQVKRHTHHLKRHKSHKRHKHGSQVRLSVRAHKRHDTTAPSAPSGLTAAAGDGSVSLSWHASTDNVGVTGYRVLRGGSLVTTVGGSTLNSTDTGLVNGTTYSYNVQAIDAAGNVSAKSNTATVTPTAGGGTSGSLPWLRTQGNRIVTAGSGADVVLRGANIMEAEWRNGWCSSTGRYQDANGLACDAFPVDVGWETRAVPELTGNWKGNVVVHGFASDPVNQGNAAYLSVLDKYVSLTAANHAYLVLAWRSYAQNDVQPKRPDTGAYTGPSAWGTGVGTGATAALVKLATRYRGDSHVIFALQVEPHDVSWSTVRPVFEAMVDQIRQASAPYHQIILVPGVAWSRDISGAITDPVNRSDVVYKTHPYDSSANFQSDFGNTYDAGYPVFIGEFGPTAYMSMSDVSALLSRANQQRLGWAGWGFEPDGHPALVDGSLAPTSPFGTTVKSAMLSTPPLPTG